MTSLALFIFGLCDLVIMTERIHKTIVALGEAALMIAVGVVTQDEAFYSHEYGGDDHVVFLLIGMMVIITIIGASANVVIVDVARKADYSLSFWPFPRLGFPRWSDLS